MSGVHNPNPDRARRAQATTLQAMLGLQPATTALALAAAPSPAVMADKLVYSHETIHLQNKLQDAGWEAEGVAHESDSDSDDEAASDEEKDLAEEIFSEETVLLLMQ